MTAPFVGVVVMARIVRFWELGPQYGIWISYTHLRRKYDPNSPYYDPAFPKRVKVGMRGFGWQSTDLEAYVTNHQEEYHRPQLPKAEHLENPLGKVIAPDTTTTPDYSKHNV